VSDGPKPSHAGAKPARPPSLRNVVRDIDIDIEKLLADVCDVLPNTSPMQEL
jgi:hypothetical protein